MKTASAYPGKDLRAHAAFFSRGGCAACFLILALCLPGPAAFAPAPASAAGHKPVPRLLSSPELAADIEKTLEAEKRGARGTRFPAGDVRRASAAGHKPVPRLQSSPELAADIEKTLEEEKRGARGIRFPAGGVRRGSAPSAASPRPLSPLLLEQAASFLGVPVPVRPGMDEGLGFHQDGTVRKAGGSASSGPSENGQRAGAYMRSGLDGYGLGNGLYGAGYGPGYDPLTGRHDPTRGGRRTSDQTRDFSDFDPLRMAQDRALSWSMGFLNSSAESLLSGITDNGRARLNFTIDWDGHFQGEGDVLLPFYDSRHTTIFMQIGARSMAVSGGEDDGNDRWIGNFGLGQRWFPNATEEDSGDWMLGYNAFFDNDFSRSHRRGGLGVELQYDWLHLASNYYFPLSGWKGSYDFDSRFIEERPAEGWDARVKAWLPFYRNVALTGAYTQWYGDHVGMFGHRNLEKDPRVWSYGLEYTPVPLLSGFLTQRQTERGRTETEFGLNFTAHFGMPWEDQMQHSKVAELRAVSGSRHEFVDRENRIILEYRAKNSYRIEYLGPAGPNVFRFRVLNGFDEFMAGQTVSVTANGMYLAEAAPERPATLFARAANFLDELISVKAAWAAYRSKSCVTDGRGEFLVELDPASLPVGGAVSVTVRAGDNEQTFTLNGNAAPLNGLAVEFSGGGAFTTPGAQGYQSVLKMTVKMYVNGVEDPTWTPNGSVTWTVTSAISGLSTGAEGVWKRAANARNGLMWVSSDSDSVDGTTNWGIDEIKGTPPTGATAYLADVVGSRRITVTAADSSGSSGGQTFTFGAGPLSVFSKTGTGYMLWSSNGTTDNTRADSGSFQYPTNTFPAVAFCGGGVNNDVTVTGSATPSDAGFDPNSGGWEPRDFLGFPDAYLYAGSYAANSRMPTARQLLAVAAYWPYSNTSGDAAGRKGAALAAGWPNVFWTGEVCFYNPSFRAWLVYLDIGYVVSSPVDLSGSAIPACVQ